MLQLTPLWQGHEDARSAVASDTHLDRLSELGEAVPSVWVCIDHMGVIHDSPAPRGFLAGILCGSGADKEY